MPLRARCTGPSLPLPSLQKIRSDRSADTDGGWRPPDQLLGDPASVWSLPTRPHPPGAPPEAPVPTWSFGPRFYSEKYLVAKATLSQQELKVLGARVAAARAGGLSARRALATEIHTSQLGNVLRPLSADEFERVLGYPSGASALPASAASAPPPVAPLWGRLARLANGFSVLVVQQLLAPWTASLSQYLAGGSPPGPAYDTLGPQALNIDDALNILAAGVLAARARLRLERLRHGAQEARLAHAAPLLPPGPTSSCSTCSVCARTSFEVQLDGTQPLEPVAGDFSVELPSEDFGVTPAFGPRRHLASSRRAPSTPTCSLGPPAPRAYLEGSVRAPSSGSSGARAPSRSTPLGSRSRCSGTPSTTPTARSRFSTSTGSTRTSSFSTTTPRNSPRPPRVGLAFRGRRRGLRSDLVGKAFAAILRRVFALQVYRHVDDLFLAVPRMVAPVARQALLDVVSLFRFVLELNKTPPPSSSLEILGVLVTATRRAFLLRGLDRLAASCGAVRALSRALRWPPTRLGPSHFWSRLGPPVSGLSAPWRAGWGPGFPP